jgi:hypothetical protein
MKKIYFMFMVLLVIIVAACSTSKITSTWKQPSAQPKYYSKIMVIGVIKEADRTFREEMENHMVGDLRANGLNAYSSYAEYGPKGFEGMDSAAVYNKLRNDKVDAVVTIVLLDKEREKYYVPGKIFYSPYGGYQNRFVTYYYNMQSRIAEPGYYQEYTKYFWESNFYDLEGKQLIYSVQTESFDPSSAQTLAHEYGKMIVDNMIKTKFLAPKPLNR